MCDKKERKVDNLINLVENHTRTERHLEQYSDIGDPKFKEMAREKQTVREDQIETLKNQILNENPSQTPEEQLENVKEAHARTKGYLGNNFREMPEDQIRNMAEKQVNQAKQINQLEQKIDESGKYRL
ncbi:MAG: hypothetical protein IJ217_02850 [Clostridia bacterium]|nr:hypothetical protein [Clostridia bacterium]